MKHTHGRVVEVTTVEDLDHRLARGARSMSGWRLVGLDLRDRGSELHRSSVAGSLFLGCTFAGGDEDAVRRAGGVVLPQVSDSPVDPYRTSLYSPRDLYDTDDYSASTDARAHAWSTHAPDADDLLVRALHDHAIDRALTAWAADRTIVGVMGGHALERGTPAYADAARLGHGLGRGLGRTVATGGGPGAMEAANLGAFLAGSTEDALDDALAAVSAVRSFRPDIGAWARVALDLVDATPEGRASLGVPTWHYGHEPPNPFATDIAKYFANAPREAVLLEACTAGIVFLPGAGGTVQEIFQDACENSYADESSTAPMVLVGRRHWTEDLPAWPLLRALARGRAMEGHIHLVDTVEEALAALELNRPGAAGDAASRSR